MSAQPHSAAAETARRLEAQEWYLANATTYGALAESVRTVLAHELEYQGYDVQAVDCRLKSLSSLQTKWLRTAEGGREFKYQRLDEITDVAGVRVVTYLEDAVDKVRRTVETELVTTGPEPRTEDPAVPGYRGVHYLASLPPQRTLLREWQQFEGLRVEVQIQTALQHAWAEIQHEVMYKNEAQVPPPLRRRLVAVAGMLELADSEFRLVVRELTRQQEEVQTAEEVLEKSRGGGLDVVQLQHLLSASFGGADHVDPFWLEAQLDVLHQLGLADQHALHALLQEQAGRLRLEALRGELRRPGYEPGPIELLDAVLRVTLGVEYLQRREGFAALAPEAQAAATAELRQLADAAQGADA